MCCIDRLNPPPLGDIFTLSNAVEPPPELWGDDDDTEAVEC